MMEPNQGRSTGQKMGTDAQMLAPLTSREASKKSMLLYQVGSTVGYVPPLW